MRKILIAILLTPLAAAAAAQDDFEPAATAVKAEPREAAVFKDGHAFVVAEAMIPPKSGWVVTLDVPEAILGTLWVFSGNPKAKVEAVRAGFEVVEEKKPCLTLLDSIEAALGQDVVLTLNDAGAQPRAVEGTIVAIPKIAPSERPPTRPRTSSRARSSISRLPRVSKSSGRPTCFRSAARRSSRSRRRSAWCGVESL